ncbi:MAG: hypothetical protein HON90_16280 [Halobacteriovoraceae bacterium]|jgi:23S rRNA (cytosine1962-C5)-methyltransferase|nr:hypothetical protein [Halobacteriovoraceae bacterium]
MYQQRQRTHSKTYELHPISIKQIQKGHPWVTIDQYSEKFHPKERFIIASNRHKPFALLIHDPNHKQVRARVWATHGNFQKQIKSFKNDLTARIKTAITKRTKSDYQKERDHYYLIFAEGDNIPGVLVHYLAGEILIQFYMDFWNQYKEFFIQTLTRAINEIMQEDIDFDNIWVQSRSEIKAPAKCSDFNTSFRNIEVSEFGVKYKVTLGKHYDHGIYTDMASIRSRLKDQISKANSLLNLYSYTGAFSLFALNEGVCDVTSVDLSEKYLAWLDENIKLNKQLKSEQHRLMATSTIEALKILKKENKGFDFIISDPPSSSSDGNKKSNALNDYKEVLPLIHNVTNTKGKVLLFINTHKCSLKRFEDKIKTIIDQKKLSFKIESQFYLSQDCPHKKGFPEGSYLKGLLLTKND